MRIGGGGGDVGAGGAGGDGKSACAFKWACSAHAQWWTAVVRQWQPHFSCSAQTSKGERLSTKMNFNSEQRTSLLTATPSADTNKNECFFHLAKNKPPTNKIGAMHQLRHYRFHAKIRPTRHPDFTAYRVFVCFSDNSFAALTPNYSPLLATHLSACLLRCLHDKLGNCVRNFYGFWVMSRGCDGIA